MYGQYIGMVNSLSIVGRLSTLQSVHYQRFCIFLVQVSQVMMEEEEEEEGGGVQERLSSLHSPLRRPDSVPSSLQRNRV